jgi:hypothetical protein
MKERINEFVDLFPDFHRLDVTQQILYMIYFHAVEEGRESANQEEIESLFRFAGVPVPKHLAQTLGYLCSRGAKLLRSSVRLPRNFVQSVDSTRRSRSTTMDRSSLKVEPSRIRR